MKKFTALAAMLVALTGVAHADEKLSFPSADFADKYEMAKGKGKAVEVFGYLTMPSGAPAGKVPVVVIAHGSGGVESKDREFWAPYFNRLGFAAFVVDSFTPRGVARTVDDQGLVSRAANTVDAFHALKFLSADPRFDPGKIGIIGFGRGGSAASDTATRTFKANVLGEAGKDLQYAFHIPMYPGCQDARYRKNGSYDKTGAPMLFLMGGKDDYTPASQCVGMIKELQAEYPNAIEYRVYEGANHSFDGDYGVVFAPLGVTARDCEVLEIDLNNWARRIVSTGERLTLEKSKEFYKACMSKGVTYGTRGTRYREMAARDIRAFLRQIGILD